MLVVQCKKCGHKMNYQPTSNLLANKKKACVYCGFSIKVSDYIVAKK